MQYSSADQRTIERQVTQAAQASISGFISSWWGIDDATDVNFVRLLAQATVLEQATKYHFAATIYFEGNSPHLQGKTNIINALRYITDHYSNDPHFLHWHGKPVLFFWKPLDGGRTLKQWAEIRQQIDPKHKQIWSAEGVAPELMNVFDGIHLFSAGYWGLLHKNMKAVDKGMHARVSAYNAKHHTKKIWAAGVMPGYNDTKVAGRKGTFKVARKQGATYRTSWQAAIDSNPAWITITSFNEWFEGSMIEPSTNYGDLYLNITRKYARQWHG